MATPLTGWTTCPICNARLKADKLKGHLKNVHPKGVRTREARAKIIGRRQSASGAAKWIAVAAIAVVIILVSYYAISHLDIRGASVGSKPYNFTLTTTDGTKYSLDDNLGSRPILIGFMSTECVHCSKMAGVFHDVYVNYSDKLEIIILISNQQLTNGQPTKMSDVQIWANDHNLQFTVMWDKDGKNFDKYGNSFYPTMYIVNKGGKITWTNKDTSQGEYSYKDLTAKLDKVAKTS
jgi:peroxiredoxin